MPDSAPVQSEASGKAPARSPRRYLAANLLLLLGLGLLLGIVYSRQQSPSGTTAEQATAARLAEVFTSPPERVGQWRGREMQLDNQVAQVLRYDWAVAREYTLGQEAISLFVFRVQSDKAFLLRAHPPPGCASAQGWQHVSLGAETLTVAGALMTAQYMVVKKDGARRVAFYWEFPGSHLDGRGQRIPDIYTVQAHADVTAGPDETTKMLRQFLADLRPGDAPESPQSQTQSPSSAIQLLALELANRSIRPGSTLTVTSWWQGAQGGYINAQLLGAGKHIWAETSGPMPPGDGKQPQRIDLTMTVPGEIPVGRYDLKIVLHPEASEERLSFVNPEGTVTAKISEPVTIKPAQPLRKEGLPCGGEPTIFFGDQIALLCRQLPTALRVGQPLTVSLFWQALQQPKGDYMGFVRLRDRMGQIIVDQKGDPAAGAYPTSAWDSGEIVRDVHTLSTDDVPVGLYQVEIGLFNSWNMQGLPVRVSGQKPANAEFVQAALVVKPQHPLQVSELAMQHRLDAALGQDITLLGYDLSWLDSGRALNVTLYWQAKQRTDIDYTVFVHLLDPTGRLVTQHDSQPLMNRYPTSIWDAGEIIADSHTLNTADLPQMDYQIEVGMYDLRSMARLPVYVNGQPAAESRVLLPVAKPQ